MFSVSKGPRGHDGCSGLVHSHARARCGRHGPEDVLLLGLTCRSLLLFIWFLKGVELLTWNLIFDALMHVCAVPTYSCRV